MKTNLRYLFCQKAKKQRLLIFLEVGTILSSSRKTKKYLHLAVGSMVNLDKGKVKALISQFKLL